MGADFRKMKIVVDGEKVPVNKALDIITDEWCDAGLYCTQTVIDLKDALKAALIGADIKGMANLQTTNSAMDAICGQKLSCRFQQFADRIRCGAPAVIDCRHKQHQ